MKIVVFGSDGFVGRNTVKELRKDPNIQVVTASRGGGSDYFVDLLDQSSIAGVLESEKPDTVINCAGVVANNKEAYKNGKFCRNIFNSIIERGEPYPRVIITGSAAEYGIVENSDGLASEDTPLLATNDYGKSKVEEENIAFAYSKKHGIDVIVTRIFNPIGPGMGEKFLLTSLLVQLEKIQNGKERAITVSRKDSKRDYLDIRDVARAIYLIATCRAHHSSVYNIGSGTATSNGELLEKLLQKLELDKKPTIIETRTEPEPRYAACADISLIKREYDWEPQYDLSSTIEEIIHESKQQ